MSLIEKLNFSPELWVWKFPDTDLYDCKIQTIVGKYVIITVISNSNTKSYVGELVDEKIIYQPNGEPKSKKTITHERVDLAIGKHISLCWKMAEEQKEEKESEYNKSKGL